MTVEGTLPCAKAQGIERRIRCLNIAVAGVNYTDTGTRRGHTKAFHKLPMSPGVEGAGMVAAIGDTVTNVKVGDRVAWFFAGSAARAAA